MPPSKIPSLKNGLKRLKNNLQNFRRPKMPSRGEMFETAKSILNMRYSRPSTQSSAMVASPLLGQQQDEIINPIVGNILQNPELISGRLQVQKADFNKVFVNELNILENKIGLRMQAVLEATQTMLTTHPTSKVDVNIQIATLIAQNLKVYRDNAATVENFQTNNGKPNQQSNLALCLNTNRSLGTVFMLGAADELQIAGSQVGGRRNDFATDMLSLYEKILSEMAKQKILNPELIEELKALQYTHAVYSAFRLVLEANKNEDAEMLKTRFAELVKTIELSSLPANLPPAVLKACHEFREVLQLPVAATTSTPQYKL
jgi:hypothetical protein